jgi:cell division protein ZapA
MPQVSVSVNGRNYRITCGPGEEQHVAELGAQLDGMTRDLAQRLGHLSEGLALVMAGLTLADAVTEARRERDALRAKLEPLDDAAQGIEARDRERAAAEDQAAAVIAAMAQRIEALAEHLERT